MGLDWMLDKYKAKDGHLAEFRTLKEKEGDLTAEEQVRFEEITVSAFEVVGAPRLGDSVEAQEWFREHRYDPMQARVAEQKLLPADRRNENFIAHWDVPFEEAVKRDAKMYVLDLASRQDGVAAVSGMLTSGLDFRGKILGYSPILSEDLKNEAYEDHTAEACLDFADRLEAVVQVFKKGHPDWETASLEDDYGNEELARDAIKDVMNSVEWLRFWGNEGFGFYAWY